MAKHESIIAAQIVSLRKRIKLIKNMQLLGVVSFFLCTLCMFVILLDKISIGEILFAIALLALMASLVLSVIEVQKSSDALNLRLSDIEEFNETGNSRK